jgi:transcriptional regulator with XRE-family HTH domain
MNTTGSQDAPIPEETWDVDDMRAALKVRDVSAVYRLLRKRGFSQRLVASLTGQSQSEVSEILKGRQVMAYDVLARIADGLGVPRGHMGLAYDSPEPESDGAASEDPQAEEDDSVKRRSFLAHAAAVTMGAASLGAGSGVNLSLDSIPHGTPAPNRIGMTDVRQVEAATKALRALDYQYGGGFCRDAVEAQLSWGRQMLESTAAEPVKLKLFVALADLHNLAGWTSFDIGMAETARKHFGRALELAKDGKNDPLVANILYRMGRIYLHYEKSNDALKLFQLGQIAAQESGSELAVAVLCANEAWAYAQMDRPVMAQKLLGRMKDEYSRSDTDNADSWVRFFNDTDVYAMTGTVHTVLAGRGHTKHAQYAIPALSRAIDRYGDEMARSRSFNLSALAQNHLIEGDIDHGARVGRAAIEAAEHIKSARVKDRMLPMKQEADKRANIPDARDLSEQIARFFAA